MKRASLPFTVRVLSVLAIGSAVSVALLLIRMLVAGNTWLSFMVWNLFLAWLPLLFALGLRSNLGNKPWLHWQNIGLTLLWFGFLPNSFYLMTDLIHLQSSGSTSITYDMAMMLSFILNGLILGYISTYVMHAQLLKRIKHTQAHLLIGMVFLASSFAIYLGRYLRWNTWDVVFNPLGLLFDLSERVINPFVHAQTFVVTFVFFVVIASTYAVLYELADLGGRAKTRV